MKIREKYRKGNNKTKGLEYYMPRERKGKRCCYSTSNFFPTLSYHVKKYAIRK